MSREAMQMALEALDDANYVARMEFSDKNYYSEAINALRQALVDADDTSQKRVDEKAKREHEPVAWISEGGDVSRSKRYMDEMGFKCNPLYTAPPKRDLTCVCGAVWEGEMMVHPPKNPVECMCGICKLGKRDWVGLTDEDIHDAFNFTEMVKQLSWDREPERWCENFAAYIEAKLKDKNHG